jgi:hypothetical protein
VVDVVDVVLAPAFGDFRFVPHLDVVVSSPICVKAIMIFYIPAKDVVSPKDMLKVIRVLSDPGPSTDSIGVVSYAAGFWEDRPVILSRWNGTNDGNPIGTPQSRGLPVWFVLDDNMYSFVSQFLDQIAPQHSEFLRGFLALKLPAAV